MWTPGTKRVYISMAILLVYMLVLSTVGFIIPSVIMLFAFCQWFHRGAVWKNAVISIAVILVIYYVFEKFPERADRFRYVQHIGGLRYEFLS